MKSLDRFVRARKAIKASRATEQGIAGHQAAMNALGNAAGWERTNLFGTEYARTKESSGNYFRVGKGNVGTLPMYPDLID